MFHPVSAFIGLRYARANKGNPFIAFINVFSVAGIALGLAALITVISVMNGFEGQLKSRILGVMPHLLVDTRDAEAQDQTALGAIDGVAAAGPFIESEGVLQSTNGLQGTFFHGIDPDFMQAHSVIDDNMLVGRLTDLEAGAYRVIIGRALSVKLGVNVGDQVRLISAAASVYSPVGRLPSQRIFEVSGIFNLSSEMDDKVVLMHLSDAARLMRSTPQRVAVTRLFLDDAFEFQQVQEQISAPSENWRARLGQLFDAVKMEKNMMALMLMLIIAVAAFNIVSALVMVVTEKQGDIAILRTQGMSARRVMAIFLFNGMFNGLKGALLGLIGGLLLVSQLNNILSLIGSPIAFGAEGQGLPIDMQWQQISIILVMSLLLCFVATLYPAYRAVRVEPATALKYE